MRERLRGGRRVVCNTKVRTRFSESIFEAFQCLYIGLPNSLTMAEGYFIPCAK